MNTVLIGGLAGSGKDTVAKIMDLFLSENGYIVKTYHFATKLKEIIAELEPLHNFYRENGWDFSIDNLYKQKTPYSRTLMQVIGTELFRSIDRDIWARSLFSAVSSSSEYDRMSVIIIPDYRFSNEYEVAKRYSEKVLRVGVVRQGLDTSGECYKHSSETSLSNDDYDYIINNNGTLAELQKSVYNLITKLFQIIV